MIGRWLGGYLWLWTAASSPALGGPFDAPDLPDEVPEEVEEAIEGDGEARESETEAARQRYEEAQSQRDARVGVLQWPRTRADYRDPDLIRNVRNRIARPSAKFYPEIDLFQAGRRKPDPTLRHTEHLPSVPDRVLADVDAMVRDVAGTPFDALSETAWGVKAARMVRFATEEVWFVDRPELREPMFRLYAYTGYAGENTNTNSPPYYQLVGGELVNYYYYLAATLAYRSPELLGTIDGDVAQAIANYRDLIESGRFERLDLSFEDSDANADTRAFASEYRILINGLPEELPPDGVIEVPLGVVDIDLVRTDSGHGLSQRFKDPQFDEDFFFVRTNARKRMGTDLKNQLMVNPNECTPELDGDILDYLAIYAKLHEPQEVFVVVPESGSTAPSRLYIWRWDRTNGVLKLVQDNTGGFPVIFAALSTVGASFASVDFPTVSEQDTGAIVTDQQVPDLTPQLDPESLPFDFQLRGHYNRLMFGIGAQAKLGLSGKFSDKYRSRGGVTYERRCPDESPSEATPDGNVVCSGGGDPEEVPTFNEQTFQRNLYVLLGAMLGRDASLGVGPRGYLRVGMLNVPHALDTTLHLGITPQITKPRERTGTKGSRVRAIADVDGFLGVWTPVFDSLFVPAGRRFGRPVFTFGLSAGAGVTF